MPVKQKKKPFFRPRKKGQYRKFVRNYGVLKNTYTTNLWMDIDTLLVADDISITKGATSFSLDQCTNYTNFTAIFDQYRINSVTIYMYACYGLTQSKSLNAAGAGDIATAIPRIAYCVDYDDASSPTDFKDVLTRQGARQKMANRNIVFKISRPAKLLMVYESVGSTGYKIDRGGQYLDCGDPAIPHYGFKYCFDNIAQADYQWGYKYSVKYNVTFKSKRA